MESISWRKLIFIHSGRSKSGHIFSWHRVTLNNIYVITIKCFKILLYMNGLEIMMTPIWFCICCNSLLTSIHCFINSHISAHDIYKLTLYNKHTRLQYVSIHVYLYTSLWRYYTCFMLRMHMFSILVYRWQMYNLKTYINPLWLE